jgi:hypothetical protein
MDLLIMPALEQPRVSDRGQPQVTAAASLHSEVNEARKTGNPKPQEQPTNAMDAFGQFSIGFGQGLANFTTETMKAAGQAISQPTETINHAIDDAKKTVATAAEASVAGAGYVANKVAHGDVVGVASDAIYAGQTISAVVGTSVDHFNHLSAKEKGYVFGHDVAPTVIGTIVAPELIPEGAIAAGAQKVMSVASALAKEEGTVAKIAATLENAREHVASISDKMATLNKKMEDLLHKEKCVVHAIEHNDGPRLRDGTVSSRIKPSPEFAAEVKAVPLSPGEKALIDKYGVQVEPVHNMGAALGKDHVFALGTYKHDMNVIRIAEENGFLEDPRANHDIIHTVHHEIGHAINDWLGDRTKRPYTPVSARRDFAEQFHLDINQPTDAASTAKAQLEARFGNNIKEQMHEAFASGIGHSFAPSSNPHANDLRDAFKDGYYKLVEAFKKDELEKKLVEAWQKEKLEKEHKI